MLITESWVLPARAEATSRSTATVLGTSIAPRVTALKSTVIAQSALWEEKDMFCSASLVNNPQRRQNKTSTKGELKGILYRLISTYTWPILGNLSSNRT